MSYFFKQKWWAVAIVVLLIANVATVVLMWSHRFHHSMPHRMPHSAIVDKSAQDFVHERLRFSKDQVSQFHTMFKDHQKQVRALKDSIKEAKEDLYGLLDSATAPSDEVNKRAARAAAFQQELDLLTFQHFQRLKGICTPEQQKKFDEVIQSVIERMAPPPPPPPPPADGGHHLHDDAEDAPPPAEH